MITAEEARKNKVTYDEEEISKVRECLNVEIDRICDLIEKESREGKIRLCVHYDNSDSLYYNEIYIDYISKTLINLGYISSFEIKVLSERVWTNTPPFGGRFVEIYSQYYLLTISW